MALTVLRRVSSLVGEKVSPIINRSLVRDFGESTKRASIDLSRTTSFWHAAGRTVDEREGLFIRLRDIFRKRAGDRGREADAAIADRTAATTTLDHPEIALTKRPASGSTARKVDVVNQKLANFVGAARSTKKFEDGYYLAAEGGNAVEEERGRANSTTIQQLAIYASPGMPGRVEEAEEVMSRRGTSVGSSWRGRASKARKTVGRSDGAVEFAARNDLALHYRCYTSSGHCYRTSLHRTQQQPPLGSPDRNISVPMRAIADFAPRNTKPPIREPNMPGKRERKDEGRDERRDERRDKKERKKPVIRTDRESVDSSENRAAMVADDNPKDDPDDPVFRYEWGVKLAEEPAAVEESDNDNFAEKNQRYVTRRLWGVNLKRPQPDVEGAAPPTSDGAVEDAEERGNNANLANPTSGDITSDGMRRDIAAESRAEPAKESKNVSSLRGTTAECLSTPSSQPDSTLPASGDVTATQRETFDWPASSEELRKIMQTSLNTLRETTTVDDDYNIPEEAAVDAEITAWRNLVTKSVTGEKDFSSIEERAQNPEMLSIRSEAPQPRPDARIASSITGNNYSLGKKLHIASMQTRNAHRDAGGIIEVPIRSDGIARTQHPRFALAFSTNPEDSSERGKIIDSASGLQDERQTDLKDNEKSDNASDSLESIRPSSSPYVEYQIFSRSDQQPADAEVKDLAKTPSANKETETLLNRSQDADLKNATHLPTFVLASSAGKDEDIYDDTEHEDNASYVDFNPTDTIKPNVITESGLVKEAAKLSVRDESNTSRDSNVEDCGDDSSKESYVIDDDYVRLPGDSYPYSREHLERWRASRSDGFVYKPIKRERSLFDSPSVRPTPRKVNSAGYAAGATQRDSHAAGAVVMETSGSGDGSSAKNVGPASGFRVSSRNQRVAADCPRGDAAAAYAPRRWTTSAARHGGAIANGKTNVAERGDNAPLRAYHHQ